MIFCSAVSIYIHINKMPISRPIIANVVALDSPRKNCFFKIFRVLSLATEFGIYCNMTPSRIYHTVLGRGLGLVKVTPLLLNTLDFHRS